VAKTLHINFSGWNYIDLHAVERTTELLHSDRWYRPLGSAQSRVKTFCVKWIIFTVRRHELHARIWDRCCHQIRQVKQREKDQFWSPATHTTIQPRLRRYPVHLQIHGYDELCFSPYCVSWSHATSKQRPTTTTHLKQRKRTYISLVHIMGRLTSDQGQITGTESIFYVHLNESVHINGHAHVTWRTTECARSSKEYLTLRLLRWKLCWLSYCKFSNCARVPQERSMWIFQAQVRSTRSSRAPSRPRHCYFASGDIWNEKTIFNPFAGKAESELY
jgi:hypothetical protein